MTETRTEIGCDHLHVGGQCVYLMRGPSHEYKREPLGVKWCFRCRAHLPHDWVLIGDPPEIMSYYDPQWVKECSRCEKDYTDFPGSAW